MNELVFRSYELLFRNSYERNNNFSFNVPYGPPYEYAPYRFTNGRCRPKTECLPAPPFRWLMTVFIITYFSDGMLRYFLFTSVDVNNIIEGLW